MTNHSSIKPDHLLSFVVFSPSFKRLLSLLHRTLFVCLLGLIGLSGLSITPAAAMPAATTTGIGSQSMSSATESERMTALIACLPKQLSQPNLKRAWSEMGDDQIERALNLKDNPKLSEAETELRACLGRKGFTN